MSSMSQQDSVSPFITQIEDVYQLSTTLRDAGYHSVFDVVRVPRKQFINQHTGQFGGNTTAVYELATGFATQISRLYRESASSNRAQNKPVFQSGLQSLQQSGPTWLGLFDDNWAAFCLASSPEANDSPVSYLTWLYNEALGYESTMKTAGGTGMITLAERRPDLATLKLDDDAINQVIPSLQLVNEILENVIQADIATTTTVYKTLAITRYPNLLPYHYAHEQTILSLDDCYQSLRDVISQVDDSWPYFIQPSLSIGNSGIALELGSNLAPEQQAIITEADNSEASDLTDFYTENFGITATDYNALAELDVFTQVTGLPAPQVEQLLSTNTGGSLAIQSQNYLPSTPPSATAISVDPSVYGSVFVNDGLTPAISLITTHQSKGQDCGQNPITDASYDSPLLFPATASSTNPPASKPGLFGQSLALYNVANSYAYVDATSNAAATMNGDAHDFTLGFWVKFSDLSGDFSIPLFANSEISGTSGTFYSTLQTDGTLYLLCQDTAGLYTGILSTDKLSTDTWYYIAFTWTLATKSATLYYGTRKTDLEKLHIDFTKDGSGKTTGSMATVKNYTWVFNDAGNFSYYGSQHSIPKNVVETQYDDIIIVWRCLKEEEVAAIISSGFPADGSKYEHYYPLNRDNISLTNLSDSRMDRINRITRLQRWLELPYDQVDKLLTYPPENYIPDSCPTANPLVLENNPTVSSNSMFDGAITFDSTAAQWAYINNDISKSTTPDWSVSMWINIQSADPSSETLVLVSYGESHLSLRGNSLQFVFKNGIMDLATLSANTWYHVLYSFHVESIYYCCYAGCADSTGEIIASLYTDGLSGQVGDTLSFNCSYDGSEPTAGYIVSYDDITLWNYGHSQDEGDALLSNIQPACGTSDMLHYYPLDKMYNDVNKTPLKTLGVFQHFQQKYNINAYEFSAVMDEITPYAIAPNVPFLDQVFNSPSLFETPFTITNKDFTYTLATATEVDARIVKQICAGLDISEAQFLLLANLIYSKQPGTNANQLSCSLAVISTFYRLVMLPRWLKLADTNELTFTEGLSLLSIIGDGSALSSLAAVPVISGLDSSGLAAPGDILSILMAASDAADWLKQHGLSASKTYALLQDGSKVSIATNAEVNFINDINQQIPASLLTKAMFENCGVPNFAKDGTPIIWTDTLKSLVDSYGLVIDTAVTLADITKAVTIAITGITFADLWTQPEIADILANLIYQTQVSQSGIATSALAKALGVNHSLTAFLLPWAGYSTYDLLNQSWALSPTVLGTTLTTETIPANYLQLLYQVARRAIITNEFTLSPAMLSLYLANPTWFGVPDTSISLQMFYEFSRYSDWLKLASKEDAVLAYLNWVNSTTATVTATTAAEALAALLDWDSSEVTLAAAHAVSTGIAITLAHVDIIMRLQTLSEKTGLSVTPLINTGALTPANSTAETTSTYDTWQQVGESFVAAQGG
jgi:hypothetical protein